MSRAPTTTEEKCQASDRVPDSEVCAARTGDQLEPLEVNGTAWGPSMDVVGG